MCIKEQLKRSLINIQDHALYYSKEQKDYYLEYQKVIIQQFSLSLQIKKKNKSNKQKNQNYKKAKISNIFTREPKDPKLRKLKSRFA